MIYLCNRILYSYNMIFAMSFLINYSLCYTRNKTTSKTGCRLCQNYFQNTWINKKYSEMLTYWLSLASNDFLYLLSIFYPNVLQ